MTTAISIILVILLTIYLNKNTRKNYTVMATFFVVLSVLFNWTKILILLGVIYFVFFNKRSKKIK